MRARKKFGIFLLVTLLMFTAAKSSFSHPDIIQHRDWYMGMVITDDYDVVLEIFTFNWENGALLTFRRHAKSDRTSLSFTSKHDVAEDTIQTAFVDILYPVVGNNVYTLHLMLPNMVEDFKDGRSVTIHYLDGKDEKRSVKFSLMGFTRAYRWLTK